MIKILVGFGYIRFFFLWDTLTPYHLNGIYSRSGSAGMMGA